MTRADRSRSSTTSRRSGAFCAPDFDLERFIVLEEETGEAGLRTATLRQLDLIVLDLNLPDMDGASIVERVRGWSTVPIIVLSVRASDDDKVRLLEAGADDYVVKPFSMVELAGARAHRAAAAGARRRRASRSSRWATSRSILRRAPSVRDGTRIVLSPKEYRLLQVLAQHAGNVVTHNMLLKEVWGARQMNNSHYLRILVRKLRRKIEQRPEAAAHPGERARRRLPAGERSRFRSDAKAQGGRRGRPAWIRIASRRSGLLNGDAGTGRDVDALGVAQERPRR